MYDLKTSGYCLESLLDILFPRRCPLCAEIAMPKGYLICKSCIPKLPFIKAPYCMKCGKEIGADEEEYCPDCLARPKSFLLARSMLNYTPAVQRAVLSIKYKNQRDYIRAFAHVAKLRYGDFWRAQGLDALIPVPLHPQRQRERGFNQAELLAREIGGDLDLPVITSFLYRIKKTRDQKELSARDRLHNLDGAFWANPLPKSIKNILIVDDVYTTGATMESCTLALLKAGAQNIYCFSIAMGSARS